MNSIICSDLPVVRNVTSYVIPPSVEDQGEENSISRPWYFIRSGLLATLATLLCGLVAVHARPELIDQVAALL